ncbi:MAG TPA: hypothetical protein VM598_00350 [Bdellovibrionota bacterium]|nr:hypothetical protein [Bdellovibrionota bacterium]
MKLRIRGNSLRLRLSRSEVAQVGRGQAVRESTAFSPVSRLEYVLETTEGTELGARFEGGLVRIGVPGSMAREWAASSAVSLKSEQPIGGSENLRILIEKDFTCLKPREHESEDESDLFPNPNEVHGTCNGGGGA